MIYCDKHENNRDITCIECNICFFFNCKMQHKEFIWKDMYKQPEMSTKVVKTDYNIIESIW